VKAEEVDEDYQVEEEEEKEQDSQV